MSNQQHAERATNVRWLIVLLLMGFTFLGHFNRVSVSVAGTGRFIGSGKLSEEQMGMVYSAFLFVYTICMLPGGWVIDRVGPRLAMTGMGLGLGAFGIITGALGWLGLPILALWAPLLVIRGLAGVMSTPLHPGAARSVSLWHPLGSRSTANGLVTAGALVGIALSYPGFGALMDAVEWQWAFIISGTVLMAFALVWLYVATDNPAGHPWVSAAETDLIQESSHGSPRLTVRLADFLGMFRNGGLVLLTLSYAALSYFQYLFFYWTEYYFEKVLGLPSSESRRSAFIVTIAMGIGMAVGGYGTDFLCRKLGRRWGCRGMAMAAMGLSAAFGWLGVAAHDPTLVTVYLSLAMGALGMCEGIFWTTAPILEPRSGGLACAFLNTGGNAGGLLAPIFTPLIGGRYGWTAAIVVACLVCALGALLWLVIDSEAVKGQRHEEDG